MTIIIEPVAAGLTFTEGPRWYKSALWFSDFYTQSVYRLDQNNKLTQVVKVPGRPSGLGWTVKGELLVVSMLSRELLRFDGRQFYQVADLSPFVTGDCNDMVVAQNGDAYIGNFGFDFTTQKPKAAVLVRVDNRGNVSVVAEDMMFPNGSAILNRGKTLVVAESFGKKLSAFDIAEDGSLGGRRVWADLGEFSPDGISVDAVGGIWVATPMANQVMRVEEGGNISHRITLKKNPYACAVGGDDGEFLYICTSNAANEDECMAKKNAGIDRVDLRRFL